VAAAGPASEAGQAASLPGACHHRVGSLSTKPGRGPAASSMSCSDKISRWNALGMQGGLLALLIAPVYLDAIVLSTELPEAVWIALCGRGCDLQHQLVAPYAVHFPEIVQTTKMFEGSRDVVQVVNRDRVGTAVMWYSFFDMGCTCWK